MVVHCLVRVATNNQFTWDDSLPLAEYAYNSPVHHSTKQMPFQLELGYEPPLPLDIIADLRQLQANGSAKTLQGRESVEQLQCILGVARDERRKAQDEQMGEAPKLQPPIDPAITAGAEVFPDTKDLAITYAKINPMQHKQVHHYIGPYTILHIQRNAVELHLPNDLTIYDTVNVSRHKLNRLDNSSVIWRLMPPPVQTSHVGTSYVFQFVTNHSPSSEGTGWEYKVP